MLSEENHDTYLSTFTDPILKSFTVKSLERYGSKKKFKEAEKVINVMIAMFTKMKQTNEQNRPLWVELLMSAAYLHNLFYNGTLVSVFQAREKLMPIAKEVNLPINGASLIFQAIEGQLGEDMPVESCQVKGDSPNRIFAWSCWFVEEYNGNKRMPECQAI